MKVWYLLLACLLVAGCAPSPQTPNGKPKSYPPVIEPSPERQEQVEREWRRLLELQSLAPTPPDVDPFTQTLRSLAGVADIKVAMTTATPAGNGNNEAIAIREAARRFLDRWRDLLRAAPQAVSLVKTDSQDGVHRLTFQQADYPFPVTGGYGELVMVISKDGALRQLEDRFIPVVELPFTPVVTREVVAERLTNRTFRYADVAGREQQAQVAANEISVKGLVILPIEKGGALEVHLAWEVVAGAALSWTVYIDAIENTELKVVQNFRT